MKEGKKLKALGVLKREQAIAAPIGIIPYTRWYYGAWQFLLSYDALTKMWIFSAMLYPEGRGSVEEDWSVLGRMAAAVGAPGEPMGNTIEEAPNAVHKWLWFDERDVAPAGTPGTPPSSRTSSRTQS